MVQSNNTYKELTCIWDHETDVQPVDAMQLSANETATINWKSQCDRQIRAPSLGLALPLTIIWIGGSVTVSVRQHAVRH